MGLANNVAFTGTFDGNGYKIFNFTVNSTKSDTNYGFFRILDGAKITNLTCEYTASLSKVTAANDICFGAVAGAVRGEKSTITGCNFKVTVKDYNNNEKFHGGEYVGGKLEGNAYKGAAGDLIEVTASTASVKYPA